MRALTLLLLLVDSGGALLARPVAGLRPLVPVRPAAATAATVHSLRGGTIQASLSLPAATGIAAVAGSLAYIRQAYIFSLSYGLSMLGIGVAALLCSPASPLLTVHAGLVAAYGLRLFAFLLWRQKFQPGYDGEARLRALDKTPRLQRTPVIFSTALFYGLMAAPLLHHAKAAPLAGSGGTVSAAGCALGAIGLIYEAVADQQKSLFKMKLRADGKPDALYTGGLYARSRHANYFGELVFWLGSFVAGSPALAAAGLSLPVRALRALAAGLGLAGIFFIMLSATKRLEARQAAAWRPSAMYDRYYLSSNALVPKLV